MSPDIIIVGAGIVGCAVAYELGRRGASVQIVEERAVGMGSTQAAAGMLAPYIDAAAAGSLLDLTIRSLDLFDDFVAQVTAESGVSVAYRRTGTLQVALDGDTMMDLRNQAARLEAQDVVLGLLDASSVRAAEPLLSDNVIGGLIVSTHGVVATDDLVRALAAGARRHGAQIVEGSRVRRISQSGGGDVVVETDRGSLSGSAAVLAAGSWSGQIGIDGVSASVPIRPVRGQLLRLGWRGPVIRRAVWSHDCCVVPWDDGTVLVGATVEDVGFDERTTVAGVSDLLESVCDVVPHAWTAAFQGARVGLRPASGDPLPIIGFSQVLPKLMWATGHHRHGVLLAPLTARLVADSMLDSRFDPVMPLVSPQRFGEL